MTWTAGSSRAWRRIRGLVLARDGFLCKAHPHHCEAAGAGEHQCTVRAPMTGGPGVAGHAHHIQGRKITGDDPRFIVAACPACNLAIGQPRPDRDPAPRPRTRF